VISEIVIMVAGKRYSAQSWFSIGTKVFLVCLLFWGGQKSVACFWAQENGGLEIDIL